ncbi:hypothetical protein [Clostridium sp.]|uniref:hypothetical protein n=1 Tax=Clostridium sp. TaxID=1506 RepID=UPI001A3AA785|nr:hypothetical protein [Clostridium sp.]MBK5236690.1 hypothetical protein [Clostridium sp.]
MNKEQKAMCWAAKENIKLFLLDKNDSFYKRRKLFRQAWKLKIDLSDDVDAEEWEKLNDDLERG